MNFFPAVFLVSFAYREREHVKQCARFYG